MAKRDSFASSFGVLVAMAGSAVGLGNLWRFPYLVGTNGGAAFIIIYLAIVFVLAMPIMYSEFILGRRAQSNVYTAFKNMAPGTGWKVTGIIAILCCILIVSFYSVVGGWTIDYMVKGMMFKFTSDSSALGGMFEQTVTSSWWIFMQKLQVKSVQWDFILTEEFLPFSALTPTLSRVTQQFFPAARHISPISV